MGEVGRESWNAAGNAGKILVQVTEWLAIDEENERFLKRERERIMGSEPESFPEIRFNKKTIGIGRGSRFALFRLVEPGLLCGSGDTKEE